MRKLLATIIILLGYSTTFAIEIQTQGFLTFAYLKSNTEKKYRDFISKDGEYTKGTKAGLQFSSIITPKTEAFVQIVADGETTRGLTLDLDIAHLNYNFNNKHKLLIGRIRLPVHMISDHRNVGTLYPWINPPEEVYEIVPFDEIGSNETFFGTSFEGFLSRLGDGELFYRVYNGGGESSDGGIDSRVKFLAGTSIDYKMLEFEFKLSYLNTLSMAKQNIGNRVVDVSKGRTEFYTMGLKYDSEKFLFISEYSNVLAEYRAYEDVKSYYVTLGHYFDDQDFLFHVTYSDVLNSSKSNLDIFQKTVTTGLNYSMDFNTVIKLEYKMVKLKKEPFTPPGGSGPNKAGFFDEHPGKDVNIISVSANTMF